jgi:hypothetical protein
MMSLLLALWFLTNRSLIVSTIIIEESHKPMVYIPFLPSISALLSTTTTSLS